MAILYTQRHLDDIAGFLHKWKLQLNANKTQMIIFTTRRRAEDKQPLQINGTNIEETNVLKYLGATLDKRLNFNKHIEEVNKQTIVARTTIGLYIDHITPLNIKLKIQLYRAYVQSIIIYAAPVWSSTNKRNINSLQAQENHCLRKILGLQRYEISNHNLLHRFNMQPLEQRLRATTDKFFNRVVKHHEITRYIGQLTTQNAGFRVKHHLINSILE